jgi:hypothetical protein
MLSASIKNFNNFTTWFEEQSKDFFFHGDKVVATKVGEVY